MKPLQCHFPNWPGVANSVGKPLKGYRSLPITLYFTTSNLLVSTDADGASKIQLPAAAGTYRAAAEIKVIYTGSVTDSTCAPTILMRFLSRGPSATLRGYVRVKTPMNRVGIEHSTLLGKYFFAAATESGLSRRPLRSSSKNCAFT